MTDLETIVRHEMERAGSPDYGLGDLIDRRDRKRRKQRITAGAVGFAVFVAAIWIVTGGLFDRTQAPTIPGGATSGPTETTGPPHPIGVGLVGLPPEGATPSAPEHGQLVLGMGFGHTGGDFGRFELDVFADGRVIWQRWGLAGVTHESNEATGLIEQRLTPEGVQLVLAEALSSGLFDRDRDFGTPSDLYYGGIDVRDGDRLVHLVWGDAGFDYPYEVPVASAPTPKEVRALQALDGRLEDLSSWLPASAWEDQEMRPFVPSTYSVCTMGQEEALERPRILELLPTAAADMLRPLDATRDQFRGPRGPILFFCSDVTTEQARALVQILEYAGARQQDPFGPEYTYDPPGSSLGIHISFAAELPDGGPTG